jgi:hypothetical protein
LKAIFSDHDEYKIGVSATSIEMDKDAKASLEKEVKGKDYNLAGVNSCLSKRTHCTNMTWKTGMTLTQSVTTNKITMDFSQNKKDLNAECKKTALLEQRLREMESALAARTIPKPLTLIHPLSLAKDKSIDITTPATNQDTNLTKKLIPN